MKLRKSNKLLFGVGLNDVDYSVTLHEYVGGKNKIVWVCPFYTKWRSMLSRCYYKKFQLTNTTYVGCSVIKEWHKLSGFKAWMEQQDWEGKDLDKDILIKGNKIYSPDTCVFVDSKVNMFLTEGAAKRGSLPIGVSLHKRTGKFQAECRSVVEGKAIYLGLYTDAEEAHKVWLSFKLEQAMILASQQTDQRIAAALVNRYKDYS